MLDLFDRRAVASVCQIGKALAALALAVGTVQGWLDREAMFAILFLSGTARAFEIPTMHALLPGVVPMALLPRAIAASASAPADRGDLRALARRAAVWARPGHGLRHLHRHLHRRERADRFRRDCSDGASRAGKCSLETVFAGFAYIRSHPILLGAISLDLFAVLLGGVTALLPIYARDILHAGPWALGLLRSAPAVGALAVSIVLAHRAIAGRAGHVMFAAVGLFGVREPAVRDCRPRSALSFLALVIYGASDAVSVVIRQSLVQMRTPHDMLGRVMAVNSMFTGSSGSLGEFRAGAIAAWLGAVPSALIGGVGTIAVMLIWMWTFPQLRRVDKLSPDAGPVP